MWALLWIIMVVAIISIWAAPQYWERKVHPRIIIETEAVNTIADVGDPVTFRCRFINPTRLPCPRIQLSWKLPEQLQSGSKENPGTVKIVTYLLPRQQAEVTFTVYAARRGVADWKEAELIFTDTFGLRKDYRTVFVEGRALIRPSRKEPLQTSKRFTELFGNIRTTRFYNEDPSLFTGVRAYRPGDPLRQISWFATAKSGELMVKQFGHTTASKTLILFNGQMSDPYWKTASKVRLDLMCERFVQLTRKLIEDGAAAGMLTNLYDGVTQTYYEPPSGAPYQLERLANRMGSISQHPMSSLAQLIHSASKYASIGDTIVLMSSYWDDDGIRALYELNRKYKSVMVYSMAWDESAPAFHGIPAVVEKVTEEEPARVKEAAS